MNKETIQAVMMILETVQSIKSEVSDLTARILRIEVSIDSLRGSKPGPGRPPKTPQKRGAKNTRMMKAERAALVAYLEIECHKSAEECSAEDAMHVWNLPENKDLFDDAAKRSDVSRGYSDYYALANAVVYFAQKRFLNSHRRNHIK